MKNVILRFHKKMDNLKRLVIPKQVADIVKTDEFYLELNDDNTITLVPIKKEKGE